MSRGNRSGTAVWPVLCHLGPHQAEMPSTMCLERMPGRVAHNQGHQGLMHIEYDTGRGTENCRETRHFSSVSQMDDYETRRSECGTTGARPAPRNFTYLCWV